MFFRRFGILGPLRIINNLFRPSLKCHVFRRFLSETHYDVLKLPKTCTTKEIRDAFISLSKKTHPDKNQNDPSMHNRFIKINEAYNTLVNPSTRRIYDLTLEENRRLKSSSQNGTMNFYTYSSFDWEPKVHNKGFKSEDKEYYGIRGVKKVSNTVILVLLLLVTVLGVGIQVLAIRTSFLRNHEQMVEQSKKYNLIHSSAQARANLYGNDHQIEVLRQSVQKSLGYPLEEIIEVEDSINSNSQTLEVGQSKIALNIASKPNGFPEPEEKRERCL